MKAYWAKCGKQFTKATNAATTEYRLPDDEISTDPQCRACAFRRDVQKGWPLVHDHWACKAGSQEPSQFTEYRGSVDDTKSLYVMSLYHEFLEQIREWCEKHPDLGAQYNQDLPDCREQLSVRCTPNRAGKLAKKELIREFKLEKAEDIKTERAVSFAGMKFPVEEEQVEVDQVDEEQAEEDQMQEPEEAPAWKPHCPYLAGIGEDHVDCQISFRVVKQKKFGKTTELNKWMKDVCERDFESCPDYKKCFELEKDLTEAERGHISCCNNTWYRGLKPGEDGQKLCYCQLKKEAVPHKGKCEWYNRIFKETEGEKVNELCRFYGMDRGESACYKQENRENEFCLEAGQEKCCYYQRQCMDETERSPQDETAVTTQEETLVSAFDYSAVDTETAEYLRSKARTITEIRIKSVVAIGAELAEVHEKLANHYKGQFGSWCSCIGITDRTARNYINAYEYVRKNFPNIDSAPEIQTSLLFAISKPSAPEELQEQVLAGDITTYKEYQDAMEQLESVKAELSAAYSMEDQWQKRIQTANQDVGKANAALKEYREKSETSEVQIKLLQKKLKEAEKAKAEAETEAQTQKMRLGDKSRAADAWQARLKEREAEIQKLQEELAKKPVDVEKIVEVKEIEKQVLVVPTGVRGGVIKRVDELFLGLKELSEDEFKIFASSLFEEDAREYIRFLHEGLPGVVDMMLEMLEGRV